ncbi:GTP-binding protein Rho1 [Orbilia oligospora]|nr:GTP-binding protein Rho1 [Orbilia oligospora]
MLLNQPERVSSLAESLETALLGCALTMSVLQEQLGGLANENEDGQLKAKKFKYVLEQDYLKELLQQARGQQVSITLLLQTYQSESLTKIEQSMQDYNKILKHMADKGISLWRGAHSSGGFPVPTAIVGNNETDSVFELSSIITDTRFDFDDQVIDSKAYRRALVNLRQAQAYSGQPGFNFSRDREIPDKVGDEATFPQTEFTLSSINTPEFVGESHYGLGMDTPSDEEVLDIPVPTPARNGEALSVMAESTSDVTVYVHPQFLFGQTEYKDPKDSRPQSAGQGTSLGETAPDGQYLWSAGMSTGLENNRSVSSHSHPQMKSFESRCEAGEHVIMGSASPFLEPPPEPSKPASEAVAETSPKRSSWNFQRLFSGLIKPPSNLVPGQSLVGTETEIRRKLVLVGDPCGKTCLAVVFCKGFFPEVDMPTIFENYVADVEVDGKYVELAVWDTAGLGDYDSLRPLSYPDSHVVLLCFSVANRDSYDNVKEKWIGEVLHFCRSIPIILVGTEKDCRDRGAPHPLWREDTAAIEDVNSITPTPPTEPSVMSSNNVTTTPQIDPQNTKKPSILLRLFDASVYYPIFSGIFENLQFDDIARFSFTCKAFSTLPRQITNIECDIDKMLSRWFNNPKGLRAIMAEQNIIIGSHFATALFSREYRTSTVRFYATGGVSSTALEQYLRSHGYEELPRAEGKTESRRRKYERPTHRGQVVEIRVCSNSPLGAFLAAVNTTHLLNLVTSHKAYALFPKSAFMHKMSFITRDLNTDSVQHSLLRYSQYDYDFQPIIWNTSPLPYTQEITSPRRVGDKFTWVIEFDNEGIPPPIVPQHVIESTCFRLSVTPDPNIFMNRQPNYTNARYRLSCSGFYSSVLKHHYTFGCSAWRAYIGARVDALTKIELYKLPLKDRAGLDLTIKKDFYKLEGRFQKPARWKYFDHLVREWWDDWVKDNDPSSG